MNTTEKNAPNFILIGAGKSATTSLAAQLSQHPDIFITKIKEPHYFSFNYERGESWYRSLFEDAEKHCIRGEASVTYSQVSQWPGVAERIFNDIGPECRFIYIMRHPVHALASHFFHDLTRGHLPADAKIQDHIFENSKYVDARLYNMQIMEYLKYFKRDNLLFLTYEDYKYDPKNVLSAIVSFLGGDEDFIISSIDPKNVSAGQLRKPKWYRLLKSLRRRWSWIRMPAFFGDFAHHLSEKESQSIKMPKLSVEDEGRIWALVAEDTKKLSSTVGRDMVSFWGMPSEWR